MRFAVSVGAIVVVLTIVGAFFAGYRIGNLEGEKVAVHQPQDAVARTSPAAPITDSEQAAPSEANESETVHSFYADADRPHIISGQITFGKDLEKQLKQPYKFTKDDALFVIATKPEFGPAPMAVVRISNLEGKGLPINFEIGPKDLMIQDAGSFSGPLMLKVKLSHTGDAKTNGGDFLGHLKQKAGVTPGTSGVDLELDEVAQTTAH